MNAEAEDLTPRLEKLYAGAVYDALRDMGHDNCILPSDINALVAGQKLAGQIYTINGRYDESLGEHETLLAWATLLSKAPSGKVLICQPNTQEVALMGELSAQVLMARGVRGYIVDGASRDVEFILENGFPTFCRFATPRDIVGRWIVDQMGEPIEIGGVAINSGDYVLADLDGVVIIPQAMAREAIEKIEEVADTENEMRDAIIGGMDPVDAYEKFGIF